MTQLLVPLLFIVTVAGWALDRAYPPDLSRLQALGTEVQDRDGRVLALLPAPGGVWRFPATRASVSRPFLDLLVRTEDQRFWSHPGVDPVALVRAAAQRVRAGRVVSGGSTLSMQAARLLEPRPRTLRSKMVEIARAIQLEHHYGKDGVLAIWLTLAPFGGNLEGVRAGAQAWFGTGTATLSPAEAALLVALPRRPEGLRPDRHAARAEALRDRILPEAAGEPMPDRRLAFPRHTATAWPRRMPPVLRSTLDLPLQVALERQVARWLDTAPAPVSIAVVIADASTREVRALVSGRPADEARGSAIDLTRAVRSPGSALKPFLYALAFQDGVARPDTPLSDLPRSFGAYAPENFGRGHAGSVTAADALRRSLNVPAVGLLDQVGPLRFAEALRGAGANPRMPGGAAPSLPLALGGAGLTLRELVGLYAGLAAPGREGGLSLTPAPGVAQPVSQTSQLVADILTRPFPGGGPAGVAWKTGTSWGGRDAWAFGFDRRHVVGVWVGRADGTPVPGATGLAQALPRLAQVFDMLPAAPRAAPRAAPPPAAAQATAPAGFGLRLLFPPPGAVLDSNRPVTVRAMGGRRPMTFLVDGAPLPAVPAQRQTAWVPAGPGFYAVTVLDADGLTARAEVRVE